jgi:NapH/MauN family ferredoxin-type protein
MKIASIISGKYLQKIKVYWTGFKNDGQQVRLYIQSGFILVVLWIGFEFYLFVRHYQQGGQGLYFGRPAGVESFLPISSLISLKHWILSGVFNDIHPAGLALLIIILLLGLILKKSFCSWICPVGLLSESLWQLGQKLFRKNLRLPRWIDFPLRSLKYILLLFFLYAILWQMDATEVQKFIYSPYNKVADVKMLLFFIELSSFAFWTLAIMILLSVVIKNFWCRYLCPYGALLGFLSLFSPVKVTRNPVSCTDCRKCTKVCPNLIKVHKPLRIISDECTACALCIDACPVENTLQFKIGKKSKRPISVLVFGSLVLGIFLFGFLLARLSGHWQNTISAAEYQKRIQEINKPVYGHNRGQVADYTAED